MDNAQRIVGRVVKKGSTVFLVAGSGSDFTALNLEERKQFVEACGFKVERDKYISNMAGV